MFVCAELIEEAGRPILSEMDPPFYNITFRF